MDKGTVLVIDDDGDIRDALTAALEGEGYRVVCSSGGAVLHLAEEARPDVILLDVTMPVLDGGTVSELLRAYVPTAHIPIVIISGMAREDAPIELLYDAWLGKPFDLADLYRVVATMAAREPSGG